MEIKTIEAGDYSEVCCIYLEGIATGIATFQTTASDWEAWDKSHLLKNRLAIFEGEKMAAWAALSPVSSRCVYQGVAEVSIYVSKKFRGKGIGKTLLLALIESSEKEGLWTLQSGIFADNKASIALHEACGFRQIGFREKIGQLHGEWKDNVIMERRSKIVGI
jgi:L-amino acid N-acyltransferase YncA